MLEELRELYQEIILDHGKHPRNFRDLEGANKRAHGHNPMCGDTLVIYLKVNGQGLIEDLSFKGKGCAISLASASMMTEVLKGKREEEAKTLFEAFHKLCTEDDYGLDQAEADGAEPDDLERLAVLSGVKAFPMRVKCATLAWHTVDAALKGEQEVSTE